MDPMQSLMSGLAQQMGRLVTAINEIGADAAKLTQVREDQMPREAEDPEDWRHRTEKTKELRTSRGRKMREGKVRWKGKNLNVRWRRTSGLKTK